MGDVSLGINESDTVHVRDQYMASRKYLLRRCQASLNYLAFFGNEAPTLKSCC